MMSNNGIIRVDSVVKILLQMVLSFAIAVALLLALDSGLQKQEVVACLQLQSYSQTYNLFYLTEREKAMCDSNGIAISAPVKQK